MREGSASPELRELPAYGVDAGGPIKESDTAIPRLEGTAYPARSGTGSSTRGDIDGERICHWRPPDLEDR